MGHNRISKLAQKECFRACDTPVYTLKLLHQSESGRGSCSRDGVSESTAVLAEERVDRAAGDPLLEDEQ